MEALDNAHGTLWLVLYRHFE